MLQIGINKKKVKTGCETNVDCQCHVGLGGESLEHSTFRPHRLPQCPVAPVELGSYPGGASSNPGCGLGPLTGLACNDC